MSTDRYRPTASGGVVPETPAPARTRVTRRITADPTSTALLLAGPASLELWPGIRRVGAVDGGVLVEMELRRPALVVALRGTAPHGEPSRVAVTVSALPPRRTPTSYVTRFGWNATDLSAGTGELTLAYAPTGDGTPVTHAALVLAPDEGSRLESSVLTAMAETFLVNLARAAEVRSRAA